MSSKEQYKDALKRANRTISDLKVEISDLKKANWQATHAVFTLEKESQAIKERKKWWQIWRAFK